MNGSGLRDETSFYYWENFFDPETFKGRPELLETIMDLGKLDNGQLVTIQEPILNEGLEICVGDNCTGPDNENKFSLLLTNNKVGQSVGIKINDMNAGCPELAIRSINQFIWWVDISSYKINGVQVPDQYLADTEIFPFNEQFRIKLIEGHTYIGLMQGFLTLPYIENAEKQLEWISYFDHDENIGEVIDYSGDTDFWYWESEPGGSGTGDSHAGIDFGLPYDTFLVASMPGYVSHEFTNSEGAKVARLANVNLVDKAGYYLVLTYGHHSEILLKNIPSRLSADNYGVKVYRGQIFLLSG